MKKETGVLLKPISVKRLCITVVGTSSYIPHQWTEKAKKEIRDKKGGKKTKERTISDPVAEAEAATYRTAEGLAGVPMMAFKKAFIDAAHKDLGIEKTLVRKALFIPGTDPVILMRHEQPILREDYVRVGLGTDLRYRYEFPAGWEVDLEFEYDVDLLNPTDIVNLIERAGFGIGVGEMRPEKGGQFGRFRVKVPTT